jgi:hypothetical protein
MVGAKNSFQYFTYEARPILLKGWQEKNSRKSEKYMSMGM